MAEHELDYSNLVNCRVQITSSGGASQTPVTLPQGCRIAAKASLPPLYDFALEKSILKKKDETDSDIKLSGSKEELERTLLVKMKSVTKASQEVCISLLESNSYDLKTSIEAYFQSGT